jgi:hypothetical protein
VPERAVEVGLYANARAWIQLRRHLERRPAAGQVVGVVAAAGGHVAVAELELGNRARRSPDGQRLQRGCATPSRTYCTVAGSLMLPTESTLNVALPVPEMTTE